MSELTEVIEAPQAESPAYSGEDLAAAFANATPFDEPDAPAAELAADAPVAEAPAPPAPAAVAAPAEAVAAAPVFDAAAYLKEQFGVEAPEAIKTALEAAKGTEALKANQRTAQDVAFEKLLGDPRAANAFLKLQSLDVAALPARELLAAKYVLDHPDLAPNVAAIMARREYEASYAAADFDDPDDVTVQEAKVLLEAAVQSAGTALEAEKVKAREAVMRPAAPAAAEGPSAAVQAQEAARVAAWVQGVDTIAGATPLEIAYTIDGREVKIAFDNQAPAFKAAALDPQQWLFQQLMPNGPQGAPDFDRLAVVVASAQQTETLVKNAYAAGKASLGPVVSLTQAVNPAPAAPQGLAQEPSLLEAFRQASTARRGSNSY